MAVISDRRVHRTVGAILLLPMIGWIVTALVFYVKPGYDDSYASLPVRTYPLDESVTITPQPGCLEFRYVPFSYLATTRNKGALQ